MVPIERKTPAMVMLDENEYTGEIDEDEPTTDEYKIPRIIAPLPPPRAVAVMSRLASWVLLLLLFLSPRSLAQTLPDCPWPIGGSISTDVTYTLTENCKVTDKVQIQPGDTEVTINGGGYSVDASALTGSSSIIASFSDTDLNVSNVTFIGGGAAGAGALHLSGPATISNVTFRDVYRAAIIGSNAASVTYNLSNILVENVQGVYFHYGESGMAVSAVNDANYNINNLVVRNAIGGNAAISIFPESTGSAITMTGCYTADGVWPQDFYGSGVSTTGITGACSGVIGNGGSAARQYPAPAAGNCGMPLSGIIESNASYSLSADCQLTGTLYIRNGVTVTIEGNGNAITKASGGRAIAIGGQLNLRNAVVSGGESILGLLNSQLQVRNSIFRGNTRPITLALGSATFENTLFENNSSQDTWDTSASVLRILQDSSVTIRDSVFRGNSGGLSAIYIGSPNVFGDSPSLTFAGCLTFENNSPANTIDGGSYITDNSTGACGDSIVIGPPPPPPTPSPPTPDPPTQSPPTLSPPTQSPPTQSPPTQSPPTQSPPTQFPPTPSQLTPAPPVGSGGSRAESRSDDSSAPVVKEKIHTCPKLAPEILVTDMTGSTQCQRIGAAGVGRADVLAAGLVDAVDVWGWVGQGTLVCFQDSGAGLIFRDSAYPPPPLRVLPAYQFGDQICAEIDRAGTVMLVESAPAGLPPMSTSAISAGQSDAFSACQVTLRTRLNFRREPGGDLIRALPAGISLTALQRTAEWFEVDYHGQRGWISAHYVNEQGDCA